MTKFATPNNLVSFDGPVTNPRSKQEVLRDMQNEFLTSARDRGFVPFSSGVTKNMMAPQSGSDLLDNMSFQNQQAVEQHGPGFTDRHSTDPSKTYKARRWDQIVDAEAVRRYAYDDATGKRVSGSAEGKVTVGAGWNMDQPGARETWNEAFGDDGPSFDAVYSGERALTDNEVRHLFDNTISYYEGVVDRARGDRKLSENQRLALLSVAYNRPAALRPDENHNTDRPQVSLRDLEIEDMSVPDFHYGRSASANAQPFKGLVVHHTSDDWSLEGVVQYGQREDPKRGGAFGYHFYIGKDGRIVQGAPLDKRTNHIKSPNHRARKGKARDLSNSNSIGISLVGAENGATPEQREAAARLGRALMNEYGIGSEGVWGHGQLQGDRQHHEGAELVSLLRSGSGTTMNIATALESGTDTDVANAILWNSFKPNHPSRKGLASRRYKEAKLYLGNLNAGLPPVKDYLSHWS